MSLPVDLEDKALLAEQKLFQELATEDSMPKSVAALRKHLRYVIKRPFYEALYPRRPIAGHIKTLTRTYFSPKRAIDSQNAMRA